MSKPSNAVIARYRAKAFDQCSFTVVKGQREILDE